MISESIRESARERNEWLEAKMQAARVEAFDYGWREGKGIPTPSDFQTGEVLDERPFERTSTPTERRAMTISDESVEVAADYLPHSTDCEWRPELDCTCRHLRTATMRAAIEAAAPFIRAEALEEAAGALPYLDRPSNILTRQQDAAAWLRDRAAEMRLP